MVFVDALSKEKDREDTELLRKVCPSDEEESDEDTDEEDDEEDDDADEVYAAAQEARRVADAGRLMRGSRCITKGCATPPCAVIRSPIT